MDGFQKIAMKIPIGQNVILIVDLIRSNYRNVWKIGVRGLKSKTPKNRRTGGKKKIGAHVPMLFINARMGGWLPTLGTERFAAYLKMIIESKAQLAASNDVLSLNR